MKTYCHRLQFLFLGAFFIFIIQACGSSAENEKRENNQSTDNVNSKKNSNEADVNNNPNENESSSTTSSNPPPTKVSYTQAKKFMQDRCREIGQTIVEDQMTRYEGVTIYVFLTTEEGTNTACISTISENALEVAATDCGDYGAKMVEFSNLRNGYVN